MGVSPCIGAQLGNLERGYIYREQQEIVKEGSRNGAFLSMGAV
jgi:hypothetical protein